MGDDLRRIVEGIQRYAEQAGHWRCVLDPFAGSRDGTDYDGVIAPGSRAQWDRLQREGVPAVFVGSRAISMRMPRVAEGRYKAGTLAARHLLEREYTHFGYIGFGSKGASNYLETTFGRALHVRGGACDSVLISQKATRRPGGWSRQRQIFSDWLGRRRLPVGVLCVNDSLAHILADAALAKGLRIPDDVGIVGAGNDPLYCNWAPCPLTSIDFDYEAVGRRAARLLDRLIDGDLPPSRNIYVTPRLVPRASTDRRVGHDPLVADALAWIGAHCHEPIRVAGVAQAVGVGERHLRRRVQRVRDRTVRQEIVLARLARARDILADTALPQAEVARACGFASERAFARAFRRYHGTAPGACRDARPGAPQVPDPLEVAKHRLATRSESMACVAFFSGFRSVYRMRQAFWLHEHMGPREWRTLHRKPPPPVPPRTFTITFIGPDGEIEEQRTHEIAAGPPRRRGPRAEGGEEDGTTDEHRWAQMGGGSGEMEPQMNADERG